MKKIFRLWYHHYDMGGYLGMGEWALKDEAILEDSKKNRRKFIDEHLDASDERLEDFINKKENETDVLDHNDFDYDTDYDYYVQAVTIKSEINKLNKKIEKLQRIEAKNNEKNI